MDAIHKTGPNDAIIAKASIKAIELVQAWGTEIVKFQVRADKAGGPDLSVETLSGQEYDLTLKQSSTPPEPTIYIQNADGQVFQAFVNDRAPGRRQSISVEIFTIGGPDYDVWDAKVEDFEGVMDEEIKRHRNLTAGGMTR